MSGSTSGTKTCLGCKKPKPSKDFGTTGMARGLCTSCRSGRVGSTSKGSKSGGNGNWLGDIGEAIGDFIGGLLP